MKKKLLLFISCLFFFVTIFTVSGMVMQAAENSNKIIGANVNIKEDIKLQFFVSISGNEDDFTLKITDGKGNTEDIEEKVSVASNQYRFVYEVSPSKMTEKYKVELLQKGQCVDSVIDYSIQKYCNNLVTGSSYRKSELLMKVLANMLSYGAAAQKYASCNIDDLADNLPWVAPYLTSPVLPDTDLTIVGEGDEGAYIKSASLMLKDTAILRFRISAENQSNLSAVLYKGNEKIKTETINAAEYILDTDELPFYELNPVYTVSLQRNATEIMKITYSVPSYISYCKSSGNNESLVKLVERLWAYGQATEEYGKGINFLFTAEKASISEDVLINLHVDSDSNVLSDVLVVYDLSYDASVATFEGFTSYGELITNSLTGEASVSDDRILLSYDSARPANGKICQLRFKVKNGVTAGTRLFVSMKASAVKNMAPIPNITEPTIEIILSE